MQALDVQTVEASAVEEQFSQLLDDVEKGHSVVIARDGVPVARMTPEARERVFDREAFRAAKARIEELRKRVKPISIEEILSARDEGRR